MALHRTCVSSTGVTTNSERQVTTPSSPSLPVSLAEISITSSSARIQWMLSGFYDPSQPETYTVLYGVNSTQLNLRSSEITASPSTQTYSTQLTSLEPATHYFYRIQSRNAFQSIFTDVRSFSTPESSKQPNSYF